MKELYFEELLIIIAIYKVLCQQTPISLKPTQDWPFLGCSQIRGGGGLVVKKRIPLPKICHTDPTMMKLGTVVPYLKKIQKTYKLQDAPLSSADISTFPPRIMNFC